MASKNEIIASLRPGSIIHIFCNFVNPPKIKYLVFAYIDFDKDESLVFVINSEIPPFIARDDHHLNRQLKISREPHYKFFNHDSFLNCMEVWDCLDLYETLEFLMEFPDEHKGYLTPEDRSLIVDLIKDTQTIPKEDKAIIMKSLGA